MVCALYQAKIHRSFLIRQSGKFMCVILLFWCNFTDLWRSKETAKPWGVINIPGASSRPTDGEATSSNSGTDKSDKSDYYDKEGTSRIFIV